MRVSRDLHRDVHLLTVRRLKVFLAAMLKHACNLDFIQMVKADNSKPFLS